MKKTIMSWTVTGLKGFGMGAANVIPGVSGGTIALLTGIYPQIVGALASLTDTGTWKALLKGRFSEFWKKVNGSFLVALFAGVLLSVFSLAKLMTYLMSYYPIPTWAFFFGLILASAYVMFRGIDGWGWKEAVLALCGAGLGVAVCTLTPTQTPDSLLFIFFCGALAICTMILPGISGSFILLVLGKYEYIMQALDAMDIPVLLVFAAGCIVGLLAFARFLRWLLGRREKQTMLVLLGFVVGSLVKVWPWADSAAIMQAQMLRSGMSSDGLDLAFNAVDLQIVPAVLCCLLGIALVIGLELSSSRNRQRTAAKN